MSSRELNAQLGLNLLMMWGCSPYIPHPHICGNYSLPLYISLEGINNNYLVYCLLSSCTSISLLLNSLSSFLIAAWDKSKQWLHWIQSPLSHHFALNTFSQMHPCPKINQTWQQITIKRHSSSSTYNLKSMQKFLCIVFVRLIVCSQTNSGKYMKQNFKTKLLTVIFISDNHTLSSGVNLVQGLSALKTTICKSPKDMSNQKGTECSN